ncbi:MAG TPA: hypothetical protein VMR14_19460 [Streptosporangiaceae bacterium]|jgi:hypothetical protein|nr:hypothetical protein [Streptosporangiaceae bacterium]
MTSTHSLSKRVRTRTAIGIGAVGLVGTMALSAGIASAGATPTAPTAPAKSHSFSFNLVPSPGIKSCLPKAGGRVTITPGDENDTMTVSIHGMPANTGFDLFVIQEPLKPFGVAWYQTDVNAGAYGTGSATVRGVFDVETFSVSVGGTTTFAPTHQYHLGLWFNNPKTPFKLGCEPGVSAPTVTPFNGEQHAGIQVLNTSNFPVKKGPLAHVSR